MGRKITVDSATLMNKGFEVIEAHHLFGLPSERIDIMVHPQSVIHSLVEYVDGSMLAQLGAPDMRVPIAHALAWPERLDSGVPALDLFHIGRLDFRPPDPARFPCLALAYQAASVGGTAPVVLNASNEVAVAAFLGGRIGFPGIARVVDRTLQSLPAAGVDGEDLDFLLQVDGESRAVAEQFVAEGVG
jgi:1-deoxy-D-xylulose-5-phosphate reductoisomerase